MKFARYCAVAVCAMLAMIFLVGCGTLTATITQRADGRVIQVIHLALPQSSENAAIIAGIYKYLLGADFGLDIESGRKSIVGSDSQTIDFDYGKQVTIEIYEDTPTISLTLDFDNYYSFIWFNEIDLTTAREATIEWNENLFIRTRTVTMQNPFARFMESGPDTRGMRLKRHFADGAGDIADLQLVYVHLSSFRRTNAGEDYRRRNGEIWEYHFHANFGDDIPDIVIIDRVANPPIWYAMGVVAALLFMAGLYFVLKYRSGNNTQDIQSLDFHPGNG